ncbi:MAG: hypothetical protein NC131_18680 [Roseburia sp.]|nr:hypothetical protein [Roseburia sp.]
MANEKNGAMVVTETINGNLVLVREAVNDKNGKPIVTRDGEPFYAYNVRGLIRGQVKKVDFSGKDKGGFEPLGILFSISDKAELVITEEEQTNFDGTKTHKMVYTAQVVDEDGEKYTCEVKPQRNSDKALLDYMLIDLRKAAKKKTA